MRFLKNPNVVCAILLSGALVFGGMVPARADMFDSAAIVAALQTAQKFIVDNLLGGFNLSTLATQMGFDNLQSALMRDKAIDVQVADANNMLATQRAQQGVQAQATVEAMPPNSVCADTGKSRQNNTSGAAAAAVSGQGTDPVHQNVLNGGTTGNKQGPKTAASEIVYEEKKYGTGLSGANSASPPSLANAHVDASFLFDVDPNNNSQLKAYTNGKSAADVRDAFNALKNNTIDPEGFKYPSAEDLTNEEQRGQLMELNFNRTKAMMALNQFEYAGNLLLRQTVNGVDQPSYMEALQTQLNSWMTDESVADKTTDNTSQTLKSILLLMRDSYAMQVVQLGIQNRALMMQAEQLAIDSWNLKHPVPVRPTNPTSK